MRKQHITPFQLNALITLFLLGSTSVVGLGLELEEDAWLVTLLSSLFGLLIFYFYIFIIAKYEQNFAQLLLRGFGKTIGTFFIILYSMYFIYIASRVVKDFSYFIAQTLFSQIDFWIIIVTFIGISVYACKLGIEAISRTSEILFFLTLLMIIILFFFGILSDHFVPTNLLPILSNDWKSIFSAIFPEKVTFPFGELIVFTLIFPMVNNKKYLVKRAWLAIPVSAMIFILLTEVTIGILGAKVAALYNFPLVKAIEMIDVWDVVQHLEILSVFTFFFVGFVKVTLFIQAAFYSVETIVKWERQKILILLTPILFLMAIFNSTSYPQHIYYGLKIVPMYLHLPFQFGIPILLLFLLMVKQRYFKRS